MKNTKKPLRFMVLLLFVYSGLITAALVEEKIDGQNCLPPKLRDKLHDDYALPGTRWIPRSFTSWCFVEPPIMISGNQKYFESAKNKKLGPKPIPRPGEWQLSLVKIKENWPLYIPYFAFTTKGGIRFRLGCRWDDVDHYYVFPSISLKPKHKPRP